VLAVKKAPYYTKVGNCNKGLMAKRGLFKLFINVNYILYNIKSRALSDLII
jgi:hypothetical protein